MVSFIGPLDRCREGSVFENDIGARVGPGSYLGGTASLERETVDRKSAWPCEYSQTRIQKRDIEISLHTLTSLRLRTSSGTKNTTVGDM